MKVYDILKITKEGETMKITVNYKNVIRELPRVEAYQNSTLRYTPPKEFPAYCAFQIGKAKIIRTWITLDEVWDYRTDTYNWDYQIGVNNYIGDKNHYNYDWGASRPTGPSFMDYLTSYAKEAEEVLFNIRRCEREVADGIISIEKYEEVVEKVIEHYKAICPNMKYIECCNEIELREFGGLTIEQYYVLYKATYRAVNRLNARNNYNIPLTVGGFAMSGCIDRINNYWLNFLRLLASDNDPNKLIGFYSMHDYNPNPMRLLDFVNRHEELCRNLGLPDAPLFINEYGNCNCTGIPTDSLKNASGNIVGMNLSSHFRNAFVFPWCTFHNPGYQLSYTEFVDLGNGKFAPTPNGNAIIALHKLLKNEVEIYENTDYKAVATSENGKVAILISNPTEESINWEVEIPDWNGYNAKVTHFLCDSVHNNRVTGEETDGFYPTFDGYLQTRSNKTLIYNITLEPHAFILSEIE